MLKGVKKRNKTNYKVENRRKKIMREPIKLCKCGTSPKIISNVDSFFKAYTIICPKCGNKKAGVTIDKVTKKWNKK